MFKFDGYSREILLIAHERYSEVFVLNTICWSPAQLSVSHCGTSLPKVNGVATNNLDVFVEEVWTLVEGEYC